MRLLTLPLLITLIHSTALNLANPLGIPSLAARSQFCANAPLTVAGTTLTRRSQPLDTHPPSPPALPPRKSTNTVLWCAPNTRTYLILEMTSTAAAASIKDLLVSAANVVAAHLSEVGDGAIGNGVFQIHGQNDVTIFSKNSNNHQQTWGVVQAAVAVLWDYMARYGFGAAKFAVFDGGNEVGGGSIG